MLEQLEFPWRALSLSLPVAFTTKPEAIVHCDSSFSPRDRATEGNSSIVPTAYSSRARHYLNLF